MKKYKFSLISLLVAVLFVSCSSPKVMFGMKNYTLENGLEVYTVNNEKSDNVTVMFTMRNGRYIETPETCGLLHLYEHMFFKGNVLYESSEDFIRALTLRNGKYNARTYSDRIDFYLNVESSDLERALILYNAAMRSPLLNKEEFEIEKEIVINEMKGRSKDCSCSGFLMDSFMFPECPTNVFNYYNEESILNARIEDMYFIKNQFFNPSNISLVISGNFDEKKTEKMINAIFGDWKDSDSKIDDLYKEMNAEVNINDFPYLVVESQDSVCSPFNLRIDLYYKFPGVKENFDMYKTFLYLTLLMANETSLNEYDKYSTFGIINAFYTRDYVIGNLNCVGSINEISNIKSYAETYLYELPRKLYSNINLNADLFSKEYERKIRDKYFYNASINDYSDFTKAEIISEYENFLGKENLYFLMTEDWNVSQKQALDFVEEYMLNGNPLKCICVNEKTFNTYNLLFDSVDYEIVNSSNVQSLRNKTIEKISGRGCFKNNVSSYTPDFSVAKINSSTEKSEKNIYPFKNVMLHENVPLYIASNKNIDGFSIEVASKNSEYKLKQEYRLLPYVLRNAIKEDGSKFSASERNDFYNQNNMKVNSFSDYSGVGVEGVCLLKDYKVFLNYYLDSVFDASLSSERIRNELAEFKNESFSEFPELYAIYEMIKDYEDEKGFINSNDKSLVSFQNINLKNLNKFYDDYFFDFSNFVIFVSGNLSKKDIKYLEKILNEKIDDILRIKKEADEPADTSFYNTKSKLKKTAFEKVNVIQNNDCGEMSFIFRSYRIPSFSNFAEYLKYKAAANIYKSYLDDIFRKKYNRCYSTYISLFDFDINDYNVGYDCIYYANNLSDYEALFSEVGEIIKTSVDYEAELDDAKYFLNKIYVQKDRDALSVSEFGFFQYSVLGDADFFHNNAALIENLTADDIKEAMEKYLLTEDCRYYISTGFRN